MQLTRRTFTKALASLALLPWLPRFGVRDRRLLDAISNATVDGSPNPKPLVFGRAIRVRDPHVFVLEGCGLDYWVVDVYEDGVPVPYEDLGDGRVRLV